MRLARFALKGGARDVLYFCLHISDILLGKNRSGFEQEITEDTEKGSLYHCKKKSRNSNKIFAAKEHSAASPRR